MFYWLLLLTGCADRDTEKVATKVVPAAPQTGVVRFVALGDAGTGEEGQYAVAEAIGQVCEDRGCDFALYLGDNIYNTGADSVSDPQFEDKFESPYASLDFSFYATLGNHDYGGGGLGNEPDRPDPQVAYTERSDKWTLPDRTYAVDDDHVRLMSLDTNAILWGEIWGETEPQRGWLEGALETDHRWKIAFGHHPYISNGEHGSAGLYEGVEGLPIISGQEIKDFFDASVCGQVDLYIAGHDHDMQWLEPTCGTHFIVSGAGAKTRSLGEGDQPTRFGLGDTLGFLWVEIADDTLTGIFFSSDGAVLYQDTITKD